MNNFFSGDDWKITLNLKNDSGVVVDLTGATITFLLVQNLSEKAKVQQNFILDSDPTTGVASIIIPKETTSSVPTGLNWVSILMVQSGEQKTIYQERIQIKLKVEKQ